MGKYLIFINNLFFTVASMSKLTGSRMSKVTIFSSVHPDLHLRLGTTQSRILSNKSSVSNCLVSFQSVKRDHYPVCVTEGTIFFL